MRKTIPDLPFKRRLILAVPQKQPTGLRRLLRNLVEAVLLTLPALYLCIAFLPLDLTPKIIVTLTIIVPLGGFGLIGISDDSMTRWLGSWWKWRRSRRIILFRGEVRK